MTYARSITTATNDLAVALDRWPTACRRLLAGLGGYPSGGDGSTIRGRDLGSPVERRATQTDIAWRDLDRIVNHVAELREVTSTLAWRTVTGRPLKPTVRLLDRWQIAIHTGRQPGGEVLHALRRSHADLTHVRTQPPSDDAAGLTRRMTGLSGAIRDTVTAWSVPTTAEPPPADLEGWCPSCLRGGVRSPSRPGHGHLCRWCQDMLRHIRQTHVVRGAQVPLDLVRAHGDGRRITEQMIQDATRHLPRVRQLRRDA